MHKVFQVARSFNQPLNKWNVSNVTNMNNMFVKAEAFNQPLNDWRVDSVNMGALFNASSFNQDLSNWRVDNAEYARNVPGRLVI